MQLSLVFTYFFLFQDPIQGIIQLSCLCRCLLAVTVWRVLVRDLAGCFLLRFSNFFFSHDEFVLGRKSTEIKCHFHHIILRRHTLHVIAVDFDHQLRQFMAGFSSIKLSFFLALNTTLFGRRSLHSPYLKNENLFFVLLRAQHLQ